MSGCLKNYVKLAKDKRKYHSMIWICVQQNIKKTQVVVGHQMIFLFVFLFVNWSEGHLISVVSSIQNQITCKGNVLLKMFFIQNLIIFLVKIKCLVRNCYLKNYVLQLLKIKMFHNVFKKNGAIKMSQEILSLENRIKDQNRRTTNTYNWQNLLDGRHF